MGIAKFLARKKDLTFDTLDVPIPKGVSENEVARWIPSAQLFIVFESAEANPEGTTYVRFVNQKGKEVVYWDVNEWSESEEQAMEVMGAICGVIANGA